ncbi:SusC/RagA family TonB-linked outer membrane protein [Alistipes sp. An54]|uniref:SusC/RagA family TonB-linked outer membrane protein n=1 Tax=Alistipes sp. An54 TaxID=1965645 RepID=UPI000B378995|nr:TonB-dependent receptor [Alistipes sp. An54]OUN76062.1 SusC/RagA family TonB-linked outer membrane protein [Alistipes sp. An54]
MKRNVRIWVRSVVLAVLLLAGGGLTPLWAQSASTKGRVVGKITDPDKQPLAGAVVLVKGTSRGTTTLADGTYSIQAKSGDVLVFSLLGYGEKEVPVHRHTRIDVTLEEEANAIDDVVIEVGYGSMARKDITGTLSNVKVQDLMKAPVVNFDQALQGRIAGVSVSSADGQPGADMDIVIRGANSLTQSNSPLYVVDGFPMEDFSSAAINMSDIASLTVLKDASATAIYGARGANGVIIIETNRGFEGKPTITYTGTYGFQNVTKKMEMMNAYDFVSYQIERQPSSVDTYLNNLDRTLEDYKNMGQGIDWQDKLFQNAPLHMHNLSMSGGTKQTKYSVSFSMSDQEGVIICSGYEKYQGRISLTQQLNRRAKLLVNASYTSDKTYGQTSSAALSSSNAYASYLMYRTWAFRPVITTTSSLDEELFDDEFDGNNSAVMNPIISSQNEDKVTRKQTFLSNAKLDYNLHKNLRLSISGGYTRYTYLSTEFNNSYTYKGYPTLTNTKGVNGSVTNRERSNWMNENTLTYTKNWKNGRHKLNAVAGFMLEGERDKRFGFSAMNIPNESLGISGIDDGLPDTTTAQISENYLMSYLARVNYSYRSRYMFTVSFRADGSSKFSPENRWGFFPSGAFAWRIGEEKFMRRLRFIDDAKLRVSYGVTGNNRVGDFSIYPSLSLSDYYSFNNGQPSEAIVTKSLGNNDLTWESTDQVDVGLDLRLFKNRFSLTVDWYQKITRDLLLNANLPYSSGYTTVYKNIGKIRNRGLEITLSTVNVKTRNFEWTSDFNISFNRSRVLALAEGEENYLSKISFTGDFNATYLYLAKVGQPIAQFYGIQWDGVYGYEDFDRDSAGNYVLKKNVPTNGNARETIQPGDIKYVDQNGDGVVNDQDNVVIGRCEPIHIGGFNNNFTYKNLSLNVFFQWRYGSDVMNANRIIFEGNYANKSINQYKSYVDHWTPENTDSRNFRVGGRGPSGVYSSRTIEDGSFLRLKTLQLSYTLPEKFTRKIRLKTVQVFLAGQNLWTWTNYSGLDPEVSTRNSALTPGFDYSAYARNRIYTAGVKIVF